MTSKIQKSEISETLAVADETGLGGARYLELFESLAPLVSCLDSAEVSMRSCQLIERLLGIEACSIFLQATDSTALRLAAATHIPQKDWAQITVQSGEGIIGRVFLSQESLLISGREAFLRYMGREPDPRYPVPTCMIVPLAIRGKPAGVINVTNPTGPRVFRERDVELLGAGALLISGALAAAALYEESRRLQEGLEEIFDSMQIGALAVDQTEHVTHLNHRARHMLELPAESSELTLAEVLPDPLLRACRSMLEAENPDDRPTQEKLRATLRGMPVFVQLTINPIRGVREALPGRQLVVIEDLTDQEEIVRLRAAESAKHSFMAIISHELRTPLTVIRGVLPMIDPERTSAVPPQTLHQVHQLLARNCNRLGDVINSILDVTEIENETLRLVFRPVDLTELLKEIVEKLVEHARIRRVRIETDFCDLPMIEADARRVQQILGEVLTNAIKFSDPNHAVRVSTKIDGGWAEIWITNTGAVIDAAQRENIFDKFRQCDGSNTRTVGGCGLGLFLARHLVRLHGGQIQLAECHEKETTFVVRLPLEMPPEIRAWAEPEI